MKNIILFISCLLLSHLIFAEEIGSLNQGACWISETSDSLKVASFNESKSYSIQRESLDSLVPILKERGISSQDIISMTSFSHCSSMGMRHVFKINLDAGVSYCLWTKFESQEFKKVDFDLAEADYNGLCDGIVSNKLLVSPAKDKNISDLILIFESLGAQVVASSNIARDVYAIEFKTKSNEVIKLYQNTQKNKSFRFVDFVTRQRPIGDVLVSEILSIEK